MLFADHMRLLPDFFADIPDPRRSQGRRHPLPVVLSIAAAAILCGAKGYKAISLWAKDLGQKARARFRCRYRNQRYEVPSCHVIREVLTRVDPVHLDNALQDWNAQYAGDDEGLAIDGKTMRNAIDDKGNQTHILGVVGHQTQICHAQKKVGVLPVNDSDEAKQTNEIGMAIPVLESLNITGKTITADALLTQRKIADYLVNERQAHYVFTVKNNQPSLREDIRLAFENRGQPDFSEPPVLDHGRIESRSIWVTTTVNDYLDFPSVGQAFVIERHVTVKKTGKTSTEIVYGVTSHTPKTANAARILQFNRDHWSIENKCHYHLDWNWDEDRCTIRTAKGPENVTALRRFAIGIIKSKARDTVASTIQSLGRSVRKVFDYLCMTDSSRPKTPDSLALQS